MRMVEEINFASVLLFDSLLWTPFRRRGQKKLARRCRCDTRSTGCLELREMTEEWLIPTECGSRSMFEDVEMERG